MDKRTFDTGHFPPVTLHITLRSAKANHLELRATGLRLGPGVGKQSAKSVCPF